MLKNVQLPNSNDLQIYTYNPLLLSWRRLFQPQKNTIQILITDAEEADPDSDRVLLVFT